MYNTLMKTEVLIHKDRLRKNYAVLSRTTNGVVWPVVKSNAYGHGSREVVQCLDDLSFSHYIVQNYFEAEELFDATKKKFLVLGIQSLDTYKAINSSKVDIVISSMHVLEDIVGLGKAFSIHLEINTGMNRHGIEPSEIPAALERIKASDLKLAGVMTHYASADHKDLSSLHSQEEIFKEILLRLSKDITYIHSHNSAGSVSSSLDSEIVRAGVMLYGLCPFEETSSMPSGIEPVMRYSTYVTQVREISKGEVVGYGDTFQAKRSMKIATIPVGYHEGVVRALSNKGYMLIQDTLCPIIGRVSMNITIIDVSKVDMIERGEPVVIISETEGVRASNIATHANTINYEITTNIKAHIPRRII